MAKTAEEVVISKPSSGGSYCLLCNELLIQDDERKEFLYGEGNGKGRQKEELDKQVAVFFLLRKVLELPGNFLENCLSECGSPTSWKIQLCRFCTRLYKEVEYLWDKIQNLQQEFLKVSYEIQDVITKSITTEEEKTVNMKNAAVQKAVVTKKLKAGQVVAGVRRTFFINLKDQKYSPCDFSDSELKSFKSGLEDSKKDASCSGTLQWNEKGVPFISLIEFESKMKDLVKLVTDSQSSAQKQNTLSSGRSQRPEPEEKSPSVVKPQTSKNDNEEEMEVEIDENSLKAKSSIITSKSSSIRLSIDSGSVNSPASIISLNDEPEATSSIRIVNTSTLMEQEEEEDNDAVPHVIGIFKREHLPSMDMESGDSLDPLALDESAPLGNDGDDPDYTPDSSAAIIKSKEKSTNGVINGSDKKPEDTPSKFKLLSIQPRKTGPKVFECSKCSEVFETRIGCQTHILRDHYDDRQPFHCHICCLKFPLLHPLKEHVFSDHGGIRTPYDDDFDPATDYVTLEYAKTLIRRDDSPPKTWDRRAVIPMYDCPVCTQQFTVKRNMLRHARITHGVSTTEVSDNAGSFSCDICTERNITFRAKTKDVLNMHIHKVHNNRNNGPNILRKTGNQPPKARIKKTMKCPDCEKILPNSTAMAEHLKNPENKCKECSAHFLFLLDLKRHMELQHANRNPLQCPYCPKSFSAQIIYDKHIDNHQRHDQHECEFCQETFTGFANLTRHLETHADVTQQQQQAYDPLAI